MPLRSFKNEKKHGVTGESEGLVRSVAVPVRLGGPLRYHTTLLALAGVEGWACRGAAVRLGLQ